MTLLIPRYGAPTAQLDRIVAALLNHDQFDDWLPDPVYYEDQRNDPTLLARFRALWQANEVQTPAVELLQLPRRSNASAPALAIPLGWRLCAHAVITEMASRVSRTLFRDKVYGFRFLEKGPRVYDAPGTELGHVFELVGKAVQASREGVLEVLDIVQFSTAAKTTRLSEILQRCGARADECNFLAALLSDAGGCLPSVDDAFAFAYNFYLQPVDSGLARKKQNFFRFRDEYFVFDPAARSTAISESAALGLQARVLGRSRPIDDVKGDLQYAIKPDKPAASERLLALPAGDIIASMECSGSWEDDHCTDYTQIEFELGAPSLDSFFARRVDGPALDAVDILPCLRALHQTRAGGVLLSPPFQTAAKVFAAHRAQLAPHRQWLARSLESALSNKQPWQAGWAATLLSDVGSLTESEVGLLLRAAHSESLDETARIQARIALARSSMIPAERFWTSAVPASEYRRRGMLLAARHLARRNAAPWERLRKALGAAEPQLVHHLAANIQVPA